MVTQNSEIHEYAFVISGAFAVWATVLSFHLMYKHSRNYTEPNLQRPIMKILLMVPIYAVDSWLSLRFKDYSLYFDLVRDCYEAYVLYQFFLLLANFLEQKAPLDELLESKPPLKHPFPTCFLPKITLGGSFLRLCKLCVLQFTIVKPLLTVCAIILEFFDLFHDGSFSFGSGYLYITILDNMSISLSMYFLVLFYMATKTDLAGLKPVPKFLCIKSILLFSFWQGVIIAGFVYMDWIKPVGSWRVDQIATGLQDCLICAEMFLVSITHTWVFGYEQFRNPNKEAFLRSIMSGKLKETTSPLLNNFADMINPKHDIEDARQTLSPVASGIGSFPQRFRKSTQVNIDDLDVEEGPLLMRS